jgi:tetratricopeptide (TPR) repeat protein
MRLSVKTIFFFFCCLSAVAFFSCKTPSPAVQPPKQAAEEKVSETAGKKPAFTRLAFAGQLEKLLSDGKNEEALALFDELDEKDASDLPIRLLKLSIMISAGKLPESERLASEIETKNPQNPDILYIQAMLASARNDRQGRTKYLNKVIAVQPGNSQALTALAMDLYMQKNYPLAKTTFIKAIAYDPNNSEALLGLAKVYYMQNELEKAGDTLNLALEKNPGYSVIWAERARVKSETNDLKGALEDIKKAVELDPEIYGHRVDYGNYLISSAKREEARKSFTEAIRIGPEDYLAYIYRAGLNDDLGYTDEAISDYSKINTLYPQYFYAAESLGILLWGKGDYAGSRAAFQQALSWNPKNTSYALMLTMCYYRENRDAEAKAFMGKYITTLDRTTTEYFLCRLFAEKTGDADVLIRITKEKDINKRNRLLFYSAMYYDLFESKTLAQKYYIEVLSIPAPNFFEYRLTKWAVRDLEKSGALPTQG